MPQNKMLVLTGYIRGPWLVIAKNRKNEMKYSKKRIFTNKASTFFDSNKCKGDINYEETK